MNKDDSVYTIDYLHHDSVTETIPDGTGKCYTGHGIYPAPSTGTIIGDKCEAEIDLLAKQYPGSMFISRSCEICGKGTSGVHEHICDECRRRLRELLYYGQE